MSQLEQIIQERKSFRSYDPNFVIAKEEIESLLSKASRAPSSRNLQPWRVIVVQNKERQEELCSIARNQAQVKEASAIVAILGDLEAYKSVEKIYNQDVEEGYITEEVAASSTKQALDIYTNVPKEAMPARVAYDSGAFAMQFMLLAKERGYDTITVGGFNKIEFAKLYELPEHIIPFTFIAIGKAVAPAFGTSRMPVESFTTYYQ